MNARVVTPLAWPSDAVLTMPGSKSAANRLLVAAALYGRPVTLHGVTPSDDVVHMVRGLQTLGYVLESGAERETIRVTPRGTSTPGRGQLDCGNAGTTLRFLCAVAAITPGEWTLTGDAAMRTRPIGPLVAALRELGVEARDTDGRPPVHVRTTARPRGGPVALDASASSQFLSALLLIGPALADGLTVCLRGALASPEYAAMTCRTLARFGVVVATNGDTLRVPAGFPHAPTTLQVEGDWSSFGVWACLDHLTGSRVGAGNLGDDVEQPDRALLAALRTMPTHGDHTIDVAPFPDQFLNLAIVAAHRTGTTHLVGGANLRHKECDRIAVMARELTRLGVVVRERPDGLGIDGGRPLRPAIVDPQHDHRVAMAFALAGLLSPGIAIGEPECVAKSYPRFWQDLATVQAQRRCVALVGMRGAGKTAFARAFAQATGVLMHDTDARFVGEHGPIAAFVEQHGWPAFRTREERFVDEALLPGTVVATGGGAIESAATRAALRARSLTVWLDASPTLLRTRLAADAGARPSITGAPVLEEIEALCARRAPLYAEIAHVRIDAAMPPERQVQLVLDALGTACRWPGNA